MISAEEIQAVEQMLKAAKADGWDEAAALIRYDMEINQRVYIANRIRDANPYRPNP